MSTDNFQFDYDQTEAEINKINLALEEIKDIKKKNPSGSVVS